MMNLTFGKVKKLCFFSQKLFKIFTCKNLMTFLFYKIATARISQPRLTLSDEITVMYSVLTKNVLILEGVLKNLAFYEIKTNFFNS